MSLQSPSHNYSPRVYPPQQHQASLFRNDPSKIEGKHYEVIKGIAYVLEQSHSQSSGISITGK